MTTRTTETMITFHQPFCLKGVDRMTLDERILWNDI